jgi:hypothetical protein
MKNYAILYPERFPPITHHNAVITTLDDIFEFEKTRSWALNFFIHQDWLFQ